MGEQQDQANIQDEHRLQEEYESWLMRQSFIRNKDDWFEAVYNCTFFNEFMGQRMWK